MDTPTLRVLSLFTGYGGLDLAIRAVVPTARVVCCVENEVKACELLAARMADGSVDEAPIFTDVRQFDGKQWRGAVDLVVGGFPCTDLSVAGDREGIVDGNASGLWFEFARIIREVGPRYVYVENVAGMLVPHIDNGEPKWILPAGLWFVLGELSSLGFDAEWLTLRAPDVGAVQERRRTFVLANCRCEHQHTYSNGHNGFYECTGGSEELERSPLGRFRELRQSSELAGQPDGSGASVVQPPRQHGGDSRGWRRGICETDQAMGLAGRSERWPDVIAARRTQTRIGCDEYAGPQPETRNGDLGHALSTGLEERRSEQRDAEECASAERAGYGLFPPGQGNWTKWFISPDGRAFRVAKDEDAWRWSRIVRESPWLDPATERDVRCLAHGNPFLVDEGRTDQLRMLGNGVIPIQAAAAFIVLARRLLT